MIDEIRRLILEYPRRSGGVILIFGCVVFYFSLVRPLLQIDAGVERIEVVPAGIVLGTYFAIFGLSYVCFGSRFASVFQPEDREYTLWTYIVGGLLGVVAIALYFMLMAYLESRGYRLG